MASITMLLYSGCAAVNLKMADTVENTNWSGRAQSRSTARKPRGISERLDYPGTRIRRTFPCKTRFKVEERNIPQHVDKHGDGFRGMRRRDVIGEFTECNVAMNPGCGHVDSSLVLGSVKGDIQLSICGF